MIRILLATLLALSAFNRGARAAAEDEAYFKQFLFHEVKDESDPDFPRSTFYFLGIDYGAKVSLSEREDLLIRLIVYMNENGTYSATYKDFVQQVGSPYFTPRKCFVMIGSWSVPDKTLLLKKSNGTPWAELSRHFDSYGKHGVKFGLKEGIEVSEVIEKSFTGGTIQSQQDPRQFPDCF